MSLRGALGRSAATTLHRLGALGPLAAAAGWLRREPAAPILALHRVNDDGDPFLPALPTAVFEARVRHLARHYLVLTVEELAARIRAGRLPRNAIAITFDDGYRDTLTHAAPVLARHGLPATLFVIAGIVGTARVPWYDALALALKHTREASLPLPDGAPAPLGSVAERLRALDRALAWAKRVPDAERHALLAGWHAALGVPSPAAGERGAPDTKGVMLSWDDLHALRGLGVSIGAHTLTHPILSRVAPEDAWSEIAGSKAILERQLGGPVRAFAYPNGGPDDYTPAVTRLVREAGFECAVTTRRGLNTVTTPLHELRRGGPWETHLPTFAVQLVHHRLTGA